MKHIVAIGEILVDFAPTGRGPFDWPSFQTVIGGAPCNFLATLAKSGQKTEFICAVGKDPFGTRLKQTLQQLGIGTTGVQTVDAFTTQAFVLLDEKGERDFLFSRSPGSDSQLTLTEAHRKLISESALLHFGTVAMSTEPAATATRSAVLHARSEGIWVNFDPNYRALLWPDDNEAREAVLWGFQHADSIKVGVDEIRFTYALSPDLSDDEVIRFAAEEILAKTQVRLLLLTNGRAGSHFYTREFAGFVPAFAQEKVVDTTGAGDIYIGAVIAQLLADGVLPDGWANITEAQLSHAVRQASMYSALSTGKHGGISSIPSRAEVEAALAKV